MSSNFIFNTLSEINAESMLSVVVGCSGNRTAVRLNRMLSDAEHLEVVANCTEGREALQACLDYRPDLVFLDIQIPGLSAINVAASLQAKKMPRIVFVTEAASCIGKTEELLAFDYNLKPLDDQSLNQTINRTMQKKSCVQRRFSVVGKDATDHRVGPLEPARFMGTRLESRENRNRHKLLVRDSGVVKWVPFDDIEWVDAAGDYMCVHAKGETLVIRSTLRELMGKLDDTIFARIHRSTIVNVEKIVSLTALPKGAGMLKLSVGKSLKVSRNYRDSVRGLFE